MLDLLYLVQCLGAEDFRAGQTGVQNPAPHLLLCDLGQIPELAELNHRPDRAYFAIIHKMNSHNR